MGQRAKGAGAEDRLMLCAPGAGESERGRESKRERGRWGIVS